MNRAMTAVVHGVMSVRGRCMAFSDNQAARFRVLNGLRGTEAPKPGMLVKLVTP